jgi:hypothetical protein
MATISRAGTGLLLAGSVLLAVLMVYTLFLGDPGYRPPAVTRLDDVADVAVFYPGRNDWVEFCQGIAACVRRGPCRVVQEGDAMIVLETPVHRRPIRFSWHQTRGLVETKDQVGAVARKAPPVAVVGSTNTVLTVALARALRDTYGTDHRGPVLLIPWATSVLVERPKSGGEPVALLDIWPGRTIRFCPNNEYEAKLLVHCLVEHEPKSKPARVVIVVDRNELSDDPSAYNDPYSVDLAECFHREIKEVAPSVEISEISKALSAPSPGGRDDVPGPWERQKAKDIWKAATQAPADQVTWVILPLQGRPTWRMLTALRDLAPYGPDADDGRLRVLCGDGIGLETLTELANGGLNFPVWCISSASIPGPDRSTEPQDSAAVQIQAEIVSALIQCLDRPMGSAEDLQRALVALYLKADSRWAMNRSLAFTSIGERDGKDLGHVFTAWPGQPEIQAYARGSDGQWRDLGVIRRLQDSDRR